MGDKTPKSMRTQIVVFGRTNVGKSSLINMLTGHDVSIVSATPGTTTDVVEKVMEFRPVGPVVFLDTAGMDDASALAASRVKRTEAVFARADVFVVVTEEGVWGEYEERLAAEAKARGAPMIVVVNKTDLNGLSDGFRDRLAVITPYVMACSCVSGDVCGYGGDCSDVSSDNGADSDAANIAIYDNPTGNIASIPKNFRKLLVDCIGGESVSIRTIVSDLLPKNGVAILVIPIDSGAPKGRLILPQVQTIRDILDGDRVTIVVKDTEYELALSKIRQKPDLVICDSQAVRMVAESTPADIPLTTFSILFARFKGDISEAAKGARSINALKKGDKVLIAEACAHHAAGDDIGRVKIPALLRKHTGLFGDDLQIDICCGRDYPDNLERYSLIIHCGACVLTRREMLSRINEAKNKNVPVTNYGMAISYFQGILERVLKPLGVTDND